MRRLIPQILAALFLLIIVGNKTVEITQQVNSIQSIERIFNSFKNVSKSNGSHHVKGDKLNANISTLHLDDSSSSDSENSDLDFSNSFDFVATCAKILVFAFLLSYTNTKYLKHHFYYDAFIRLFSHKYIVLRNLRI